MKPEGTLEFPGGGRTYPGRHAVVDATLVRGAELVPVVVKKTRTTQRERLGTLKAVRSFEAARELSRRGLPTPEALGVEVHAGESWYVARRLDEAVQIRVWFMHRDDARNPPPPLPIPLGDVIRALGRLGRRLHDAGVFFRDFTDGNVLLTGGPGAFELWLVDLNRARLGDRPVPLFNRLRDLARPGLNREDDRNLLLQSYFSPDALPSWVPRAVSLLRARIVYWDDLKRRLRPWRR
jgi:Lipopolysaccharide kinase (Kdo/WaaP) family